MKHPILCIISALLIMLSITACTAKQTASAVINIHSAAYLNPDIHGNPVPVVLIIYQLKSAFNFNQASFAQLASNSNKVLATDLLDKISFEIRPSQNKSISLPLQPNTQYLGIIAAYRNINQANWRKVIKVSSEQGIQTLITLVLESQQMSVSKKQSDAEFGFGI